MQDTLINGIVLKLLNSLFSKGAVTACLQECYFVIGL